MKYLKYLYHNLEEIITASLFVVLLITVTLEIVMRNLLNTSYIGSNQLSQLIFLYIVFIGMAIAIKRNVNVLIEYFPDKLPIRIKYWLYLSFELVILVIIILIIYYTYVSAQGNKIFKIDTLGISAGWSDFSALLGSCFMLWRQIEKIILMIYRKDFLPVREI